jgi:hypothetical protein
MTRKIYRTAQGKQVDLGALQLQNENVRAVGNMSVNARGDLVDGWNRPIDTKNNSVQKAYQRQTGNVKDEPVTKQVTIKPSLEEIAKSKPDQDRKTVKSVKPKSLDQEETKPTEPVSVASDTAQDKHSGLANAIARARTVRQNPIRSHQDLIKKSSGINKI